MQQKSTQSGAALFVSLMMLLVMTLLALAAISTSVLQERMVGNTFASLRYNQQAQSALAEQELAIYRYAVREDLGTVFTDLERDDWKVGALPWNEWLVDGTYPAAGCITVNTTTGAATGGVAVAATGVPDRVVIEAVEPEMFLIAATAATCDAERGGRSVSVYQSYFIP